MEEIADNVLALVMAVEPGDYKFKIADKDWGATTNCGFKNAAEGSVTLGVPLPLNCAAITGGDISITIPKAADYLFLLDVIDQGNPTITVAEFIDDGGGGGGSPVAAGIVGVLTALVVSGVLGNDGGVDAAAELTEAVVKQVAQRAGLLHAQHVSSAAHESRALAAAGHPVTVLCERLHAPAPPGIAVHELGEVASRPRWLALLRFSRRVERWLREHPQPGALIHSHERLGVHQVTTFHGPPFATDGRSEMAHSSNESSIKRMGRASKT
jgi:hypothetical protein